MSIGVLFLDKVFFGKIGVVSDWVVLYVGIKLIVLKLLMSLVLLLVFGLIGWCVGGGGVLGLKNLFGRFLGFV